MGDNNRHITGYVEKDRKSKLKTEQIVRLFSNNQRLDNVIKGGLRIRTSVIVQFALVTSSDVEFRKLKWNFVLAEPNRSGIVYLINPYISESNPSIIFFGLREGPGIDRNCFWIHFHQNLFEKNLKKTDCIQIKWQMVTGQGYASLQSTNERNFWIFAWTALLAAHRNIHNRLSELQVESIFVLFPIKSSNPFRPFSL